MKYIRYKVNEDFINSYDNDKDSSDNLDDILSLAPFGYDIKDPKYTISLDVFKELDKTMSYYLSTNEPIPANLDKLNLNHMLGHLGLVDETNDVPKIKYESNNYYNNNLFVEKVNELLRDNSEATIPAITVKYKNNNYNKDKLVISSSGRMFFSTEDFDAFYGTSITNIFKSRSEAAKNAYRVYEGNSAYFCNAEIPPTHPHQDLNPSSAYEKQIVPLSFNYTYTTSTYADVLYYCGIAKCNSSRDSEFRLGENYIGYYVNYAHNPTKLNPLIDEAIPNINKLAPEFTWSGNPVTLQMIIGCYSLWVEEAIQFFLIKHYLDSKL